MELANAQQNARLATAIDIKDSKIKKEKDRETYSLMVSLKTPDGILMNKHLQDKVNDGCKVGTYLKTLIKKDMNNVGESDFSTSGNSAIMKQLESQTLILNELRTIIKQQSDENKLLKTLLEGGININVSGGAQVGATAQNTEQMSDDILDAKESSKIEEATNLLSGVGASFGNIDTSWQDESNGADDF